MPEVPLVRIWMQWDRSAVLEMKSSVPVRRSALVIVGSLCKSSFVLMSDGFKPSASKTRW